MADSQARALVALVVEAAIEIGRRRAGMFWAQHDFRINNVVEEAWYRARAIEAKDCVEDLRALATDEALIERVKQATEAS